MGLQPYTSDNGTESVGWSFPEKDHNPKDETKENETIEDETKEDKNKEDKNKEDNTKENYFKEDSPTMDEKNSKFKNIFEIYQAAGDISEEKFTLPILWDTTHRTIVNNNFYDILRMLNS